MTSEPTTMFAGDPGAIVAGLADFEAGRVVPHEDVKVRVAGLLAEARLAGRPDGDAVREWLDRLHAQSEGRFMEEGRDHPAMPPPPPDIDAPEGLPD